MRNLVVCIVLALVLATGFATAPAGAAPARVQYLVVVDLVRGSFQPLGPVCVQTNVFKQGEEVVWRAEVREAATGREIGNDGKNVAEIAERGLTAIAFLENGPSFPMKYGQHPGRAQAGEPVNFFWTTAWKIPDDYPTGTVKWWVIVRDKAGAFIRFDPIGVGTNLPNTRIIIEKK